NSFARKSGSISSSAASAPTSYMPPMTPPPASTSPRRAGVRLQPRRSSQPRRPFADVTVGSGRRSRAGEGRRPLLEEGADPLRVVLGGDGLGLGVSLEAERRGQVHGGRAVQQGLGETQRRGRARRRAGREGPVGLLQV